MNTAPRLFVSAVLILFVAGCSERRAPDSEVFTLYSTSFPNDFGRYGVATFDLADETVNSLGCQEAVELYSADFEKRKRENGLGSATKMRYWCEKGRFKK
jgi:hypothetical protein